MRYGKLMEAYMEEFPSLTPTQNLLAAVHAIALHCSSAPMPCGQAAPTTFVAPYF